MSLFAVCLYSNQDCWHSCIRMIFLIKVRNRDIWKDILGHWMYKELDGSHDYLFFKAVAQTRAAFTHKLKHNVGNFDTCTKIIKSH